MNATETVSAGSSGRTDTFRFSAGDVTGTREIEVSDIPRGTPAGSVAQALAARMDLPGDVAWALRSDRTGAWLADDLALDEQIADEPQPRLTLTPKTHLG